MVMAHPSWYSQAVLPNQMHAQLTELIGLKGNVGKRCIVMGLISSQEDGGLTLEDEAATVPIDVSHAKMHAGLVTGKLLASCSRLYQLLHRVARGLLFSLSV